MLFEGYILILNDLCSELLLSLHMKNVLQIGMPRFIGLLFVFISLSGNLDIIYAKNDVEVGKLDVS